MSTKALAWVWEHSSADGSRMLLHLALADEARDDGYISGKEFGSLTRMQDKCRFASRQTIVDARNWLVAAGQLLVQTPADRGWGRHNEYVIIMGRDAAELARSIGWAPPQQSDPQTVQQKGGAPTSPARSAESDTIPRADRDPGAHRGAQAVPTATPVDQAAEPVDTAVAEPPRTVRSVDRTNRETGPGPVQDRSTEPDATQETQAPPTTIDLTSAHERHPESARASERETRDVLGEVRRQLAALAPQTAGVRWDITARQNRELTVHGLAWFTRDELISDWTAAAAGEVRQRGHAPFSARAWVPMWLALTPPAITADEPLCVDHPVGDLTVPARVCALCRTAAMVS